LPPTGVLLQSYNKKKGVIRRGLRKQSNQIQSCLEELTHNLASDAASCAQIALVSPSAIARAT
jgi:hypothetical protein